MKPDSPVVAEVRRARARIAARFGYDLHRYCQYLMKQQEKETSLIKAPPAKPTATQASVTRRHAAKTTVRRTRSKNASAQSPSAPRRGAKAHS
jgi:hypothetical protein